MTTDAAAAARQRAFCSAFELVLASGGESRGRGLRQLRELAMEGYSPAILALAEELVREPDPGILESAEDWALAAYPLGHTTLLDRLIARAELAGADTAGLRRRRYAAAGGEAAWLAHYTHADVAEAIGMVEAGEPHRVFGLERLRKLARQRSTPAGLAYAEELVADAPQRQRPARAGWAESVAQLGHHTPMLRFIALMETEGNRERAEELRARHAQILAGAVRGAEPENEPETTPAEERRAPEAAEAEAIAREQAAAETDAAERAAGLRAAEEIRAAERQERDAAARKAAAGQFRTGASVPPASGRAGGRAAEGPSRSGDAGPTSSSPKAPPPAANDEYAHWQIKLAVVLLIFACIPLLNGNVRHWISERFAEVPSTSRPQPRQTSSLAEGPGIALSGDLVSASTSARTYLDTQVREAEAQAEALLKEGKEQAADDAVVMAIEAAMVAGDLDALERLLDRQVGSAKAAAAAEANDRQAVPYLKKVIEALEDGIEISVKSGFGAGEWSFVKYDVKPHTEIAPCSIEIRERMRRGNPGSLFAGTALEKGPVTVNLGDLYYFGKSTYIYEKAKYYHRECPDWIRYYKGILIGLCEGESQRFSDALFTYIKKAGCVDND